MFESYIKNREYMRSDCAIIKDFIISDKFQKEIVEFNDFFIQEILPKLKDLITKSVVLILNAQNFQTM